MLALSPALPARAGGAPGGGNSIIIRANTLLKFVCAQDRSIMCVEQDSTPFMHYTGAECADAGLAPECVIRFVPGAKVTGELVVSADDEIETGGIATTLLYEFRILGRWGRQTLVETFGPDTPMGNWNPTIEESNVFDLQASSEGQILDGTLQPIADALTEMVAQHLASKDRDLPPSLPVITNFQKLPFRTLNSDHSDVSNGGDPIGSSQVYRVDMRFAEVR